MLQRIGLRRRALPLRHWARAVCEAETEHARAEFWRLARELKLGGAFDRYLEPACHEHVALAHERKAGQVLNWLLHLSTEETEIAKAIGLGMLRGDRGYLRALFRRRLALKQGYRKSFAEYRALRAIVDRPCA